MHPILFRLGPWEVHSYGAMLMLSFLLGTWLAARRARGTAITSRHVALLAVTVVIAALLGSRLAYVALNWSEFKDDWSSIVNPMRNGRLEMSGLVMNGGVVAASLALIVVARVQRLPLRQTLDVFAPSLPLGECLTRIGCFLNGCCYGEPTKMPWGVSFPAGSQAGDFQRTAEVASRPLHPAQLYSSLSALVIFVLLLVLERRYKRFEGFTALTFFLLYGVARFLVEHVRHYHEESGMLLGLTHNQVLSIVLVAGSAAALAILQRRACRPLTP